jgi:uncharacterized membrane protein YkvA (DUF1232 family)
MKTFIKLKETLNNFKKAINLFFDKKIPLVYKLVPVAALTYVLFPFDFIPDWFPFLGQLDDLAILMGASSLFLRLAQRHEQKNCS